MLFRSLNLLLLALQLDIAQEADGDGGQDDTYDTKGAGTGITVGNKRCIGTKHRGTGFVGRTETGRVGDGATEHTHHHGQVASVLADDAAALVEDKEIQTDAAGHVQQDDAHGHQVHLDARRAQALKEARAYLQSDAVDKQDETEVLNVGENVRCAREAQVAGQDAGEEDERHAQRYSENLDTPECDAQRDDCCIEQHDVGHRIGITEQSY